MAAGSHFGCPKVTSYHFRSIPQFLFLWNKMAAGGHFGCPKFTFDRISGHFRSIRNFFLKFFTKWPPADIFDVRKSLLIAFLAISDRSVILDVWNSLSIAILAIFRRPFWMSQNHFRLHFWSIGHFRCPKFTFDGISGHFRSTRILIIYLWQNGHQRPFWMSENNFWSHFWPFQIDTGGQFG